MESAGSGNEVNGDRLANELAHLRAALDDLRRRPVPLDADTLRHVVTASLSEATAPPPNLLVTAIRRLDRLDARLESIESALGGQASLPAVGPGSRGRPGSSPSVASVAYAPPAPDAEALAEALARRLAGTLSSGPASGPPGGGATMADLVSALRPLLPGAARSVLLRAGREPSAQAVEVLHQAALAAVEEAAGSLGPSNGPASAARPAAPAVDPQRAFAPLPPRPALAPAPPPTPPPPPPPAPAPPPLDVEALAATIAVRVTASVAASVARQLTVPPPAPAAPSPPPPEVEPPPPVDPAVVAEAVVSRLAEQPPPQAVVSAMAMAPLLSAVGNVEAAVAQLADPEADVAGALGRLEAGIDALAHALEEDRGDQADEVRRGFAEVTDLVRQELATHGGPGDWGAGEAEGAEGSFGGQPVEGEPDQDRTLAAVLAMHRRFDRVRRQLAPLAGLDRASISGLEDQGRRLERSVGNILTALAALADHIQDQSSSLRAGLDDIAAAGAQPGAGGPELAGVQHDLAELGGRLDELLAATVADRQRFQRLGGSIDGLAELLGQVTERLGGVDHLPEPRTRAVPAPPPGKAAEAGAQDAHLPDVSGPADDDDDDDDDDEPPKLTVDEVTPPAAAIEDHVDGLSPSRPVGSARRRRRRFGGRNPEQR